VHGLTALLAAGAKKLGLAPTTDSFFDTITIKVGCANVLANLEFRG
jgi:hypothetical protein